MTELLAVIAPLLLIDALNPVLFAVLIYAAGGARPVANSSAMLLGHTLAYFLVGLLASTGIQQLTDRLDNPQPIDFVIEFFLGVAFLYAALASRAGGASEERKPARHLPCPIWRLSAKLCKLSCPRPPRSRCWRDIMSSTHYHLRWFLV